jgi:sulfite exporter TauE/SafE
MVLRHPFIAGLAWGILPCGLLYSVVPLTIFAGDALSGAILMAVFGLSALPHLLVSQKLLATMGFGDKRKWFSVAAGIVLISLALAGVAGLQSGHMPDWLCVVPSN